MRNRATKKGVAESAGPRVFYVYCVGRREELEPHVAGAPGAIEEGAGVEAIAEGGLAAAASAVPAADYGEEALAARLGDPAWTAARALRHERVVEHFAARAGVVPLRFGTIYLRREGVASMLDERRGELSALVKRLRGRDEWGVNLFCDRERLKAQITSVSPRLRRMGEEAAGAPPGQGYLLRKKIEALRDDETRAETKRAAAEIGRALAATCEASARLRVLRAEVGERGDLVAKFAFLVPRPRFEEFRAAAERLAWEYAGRGFKLELTGPWPAYNFTATVEGGGDDGR